MILVLSQEDYEPTTEQVIEWIEHLGGDCVRLNGEDLTGGGAFALRWEAGRCDSRVRAGGREFGLEEVGVVWLRRWHQYTGLRPAGLDPALAGAVETHLMREVQAATLGLHAALSHAEWLTHPSELRLPKLLALQLAARAGLQVPATLLTSDVSAARAFCARYGRVITKAVGEADSFLHDGAAWGMYTAEVDPGTLGEPGATMFPSLLQERLDKAYELRVFYLDGRCHPMAIFSQSQAQTATDFRRYDPARPSRTVPYRLPAEVEDAVHAFMALAGLSTGSLDFVKTPDGRHVFLEVNPAGQLGMVSAPCNYDLEKKVAEYLVRKDRRAAAA